MDLLLSMSIFTSPADISREKTKAQEWMRAWVARDVDINNKGGQGATAAEKKKPQARGPHEKKKKQQGRPRIAPEFDGLNCFETLVTH